MSKGDHNRGKGKCYAWLSAHVSHTGDACLPWPFARDRKGYGSLGHLGKHYWAHRLMCTLAHGDPPTPKHQAAHECGKGHYGCVNPRHLAWKTTSENQLDRRATGSMNRGRRKNGTETLLSDSQIAQIIALKGRKTQTEIAKMFGVSPGCVQYWQHARAQRYVETPEAQYRIDALLATGPKSIANLADALYPGRITGQAIVSQRVKRHGFVVANGLVQPRAGQAESI